MPVFAMATTEQNIMTMKTQQGAMLLYYANDFLDSSFLQEAVQQSARLQSKKYLLFFQGS